MPIYEVTHGPTGKTFELTGERPPTEQELDEIFNQAITSSATKPPEELTPIEQQWNSAVSTLGTPKQEIVPPLAPPEPQFKPKEETGIYLADKKISEIPADLAGTTAKGFIRGAEQLKGIGQALGSMAADVAGQDLLAKELMNDYTATMKTVKEKYAPQVGELKNIKTPEDAATYVAETVGEMIPMFLPSLATGGVGAIAAKTLAKGAAEKLVAEVGAKRAAEFVAKRVALGSAIGAAPTSIGLETGSIYGDIYEKTGKREAGKAALFGVAAGALDAIPVVTAIRNISKPFAEGVKQAVLRRYGEAAAKQFLSEGLTEGGQTMLEEAAVKSVNHEDYFTKELFDNVLNSIVKGGIGGTVVGGGTQAIGEGIQKIKGTPEITDKANIPQLGKIEEDVTETGTNLPMVEEKSAEAKKDEAVNQPKWINDVVSVNEKDLDNLTELPAQNISHKHIAEYKNNPNVELLYFDIDNFKDVNDEYGHDTGDAVLKALGNEIKTHFGDKVVDAGRIGGEEFYVAFNKDEGNKEIIQQFVNSVPDNVKINNESPISISGGLASGSIQEANGKERVLADKLLYESKKGGRNRVAFESGGKVQFLLGKEGLEKNYVDYGVLRRMEEGANYLLSKSDLSPSQRATAEGTLQTVAERRKGLLERKASGIATEKQVPPVIEKPPTPPAIPIVEQKKEPPVPIKKGAFVPGETTEQATQRQRSVKQAIKESTGIERTEEDIVISEHDALKAVLQSVQRNTKIASGNIRKDLRREMILKSKSKAADVKEMQDMAKAYADISEITSQDRLRLQSNIKDIKSPSSLWRILQQADIMEQKAGRDKAIAELKKTMARAEEKVKKMRPEYVSKIQPILDSIDPQKHTQGKIDKLNAIVDWLESDPENVLPPDVMKSLRILEKKNVADMTVDDINDISNTLQLYLHLNELKNKLISKGKAKEFAETRDKMIETLLKTVEKQRQKDSMIVEGEGGESKATTGGLGEKVKNVFTTGSSSMEFTAQKLDGTVDKGGVFHEIFYDGINEGQRITDTQYYDAIDYFRNATKDIDMDGWSEAFYGPKEWKKKVNYTKYELDSGVEIWLSPAERGAIYLHSLNDNNLRHLLEGGISRERERHIIIKLTGGDINKIVNSMSDKEKKVADIISNYLNTKQKTNLNKTSVDINGFEIAKEDNYWNIRTNDMDRSVNSLKLAMTPENVGGFSQVSIEGMGMLKSRTKAKNAIILDDMFVGFVKSIDQATNYCGLAPALRNAKMCINDKQIKQEIVKRFGENYLDYIKKFIRDIEGNATETTDIDRVITTGMGKLSVGVLGANPFVVMIQPASYPLAMTEINGKYLFKAMKTPEKEEIVKEWSPELRKRFEGMSSTEMGEVMNAGSVRMVVLGSKNIGQKIMGGIIWADKQTILRLWKAVQLETEELHPELTGDDKMEYIARRTELVTRRTQSVSDTKDRSEIARIQNMAVRLLTMFTSQSNKIFEGVGRGILRYNDSPKGKKDKAALLGTLSLLIVGNGLMLAARDAIKRAIAGDFDKDPFDAQKREFNLGLRLLSSAMSNIYIVGPAFNSLVSYMTSNGYGGYSVQDPLTASINEAVKGGAEVASLVENIATQEKYKDGEHAGELKFKSNTIKLINSLGKASVLAGIPYNSIKYVAETATKRAYTGEKQTINLAISAMASDDWFKRQAFRAWYKEADKDERTKFVKAAYTKYGQTYYDKLEKSLDELQDRDNKFEAYQKSEEKIVNDYINGTIKKEEFSIKKQKIDEDRKRFISTGYGKKPPKKE